MQDLKPTVWIGKQGCTETMIDEIVEQLKKRKMIKVKWLQNTEVDPEMVASQAQARLVNVREGRWSLKKKRKQGKNNKFIIYSNRVLFLEIYKNLIHK